MLFIKSLLLGLLVATSSAQMTTDQFKGNITQLTEETRRFESHITGAKEAKGKLFVYRVKSLVNECRMLSVDVSKSDRALKQAPQNFSEEQQEGICVDFFDYIAATRKMIRAKIFMFENMTEAEQGADDFSIERVIYMNLAPAFHEFASTVTGYVTSCEGASEQITLLEEYFELSTARASHCRDGRQACTFK